MIWWGKLEPNMLVWTCILYSTGAGVQRKAGIEARVLVEAGAGGLPILSRTPVHTMKVEIEVEAGGLPS